MAYRASAFCDFALALSVSIDGVVLSWVLLMFQARMRDLVEPLKL